MLALIQIMVYFKNMNTKQEIFYETWFSLGMPEDRLIYRASAAFFFHKIKPISAREHSFIIRKFKGDDYAKKAYVDYMTLELKLVHRCSRCGGSGVYGYTTGTCYGCNGAGWLAKENYELKA